MMFRKAVFSCLLMAAGPALFAQTDGFMPLNRERIAINKTGMTVLGSWAAANIVTGIVGYSTAKSEEWRSFHQMNTLWGVVNLAIAGAGYLGARKEAHQLPEYRDALKRYEANKRLFLINAGLDGLYIATGVFLTEHAKTETNHPEVWRGYGKSIALQGAGLLLFDAVMFTLHQRNDQRWYKVLDHLTVNGSGVGFRYRF